MELDNILVLSFFSKIVIASAVALNHKCSAKSMEIQVLEEYAVSFQIRTAGQGKFKEVSCVEH